MQETAFNKVMPKPKLDPTVLLNMSVSLPADLVDLVDEYAREHTGGNFSEAICQMLREYSEQKES